jgi:hypothetical protein
MNETRETATAERYQAIPHLAGDIASDRVEDSLLFHKNVAQGATFL